MIRSEENEQTGLIWQEVYSTVTHISTPYNWRTSQTTQHIDPGVDWLQYKKTISGFSPFCQEQESKFVAVVMIMSYYTPRGPLSALFHQQDVSTQSIFAPVWTVEIVVCEILSSFQNTHICPSGTYQHHPCMPQLETSHFFSILRFV